MIPEEILTDARLSHRDVRVYGFLAMVRRGDAVTVGERRVGKQIHIDRRNVRASLAKLIAAGHVEVRPRAKKERARYRLTAPRFALPSLGVGGKLEIEPPDWSSTPPLVTCPRCHDKCRQIQKVGWCRSCSWRDKVVKTCKDAKAAGEL